MGRNLSILDAIRLLFNPSVSNRMILQLVFQQAKIIGLAKILSAILGGVIIGGSSVVKIPQIKKIIDSKTLEGKVSVAKGISYSGVSVEALVYLIHVAYNRQIRNSFVNYGEAFFLGLQDVALILLIDFYRAVDEGIQSGLSQSASVEKSLKKLLLPVIAIISVSFTSSRLPESMITTLQLLNIPLAAYSKSLQVLQNYRLGTASHLSKITVGANLLGSLIRVFTTVQSFKEVGKSYVLLGGYSASLILNSVLAFQCFVSKSNDSTLPKAKPEGDEKSDS